MGRNVFSCMPGGVEIIHELFRGQHAVWKQSGPRDPPNIEIQTQWGVGQYHMGIGLRVHTIYKTVSCWCY